MRAVCRRRGALAAVLLALLALQPVSADTVRGYVVDAATDARLADVDVAFLISDATGFSEMVRRRSGPDGSFVFDGPFLKANTPFALSASFEGMDYVSGPLRVGEQDQVILEVFEATADDDRIRIDGHHLFLAVTEAGLDVAQLIQVDNGGAQTFVGSGSGGDDQHVLEFTIPEGSQSLQGHSGEVHQGSPTQVFTVEPLPPGRSQITFTFQVDGDAFDGDYVHETRYPTQRLELFLQPASIELPGPEFEDLGPLSLHDATYRHYRVTNLAPGRRVEIPLPFSTPIRWALKWVLVGLVPVAVLAALGLTRTMPDAGSATGPAAPATGVGRLEARRRQLLAELALTDNDLAGATGPAADDLRQRRDRLKAEVADVYRQLDAGLA